MRGIIFVFRQTSFERTKNKTALALTGTRVVDS